MTAAARFACVAVTLSLVGGTAAAQPQPQPQDPYAQPQPQDPYAPPPSQPPPQPYPPPQQQPYPPPQQPYPPPQQPYPPPQPYGYPPPYGYPAQPQYHLLTAEERELVAEGEIEPPAHIIGGALGTFVGLGLGHAVQGRWDDKGWIFTVGEIASFSLILIALGDCGFESNCEDEAQTAWFGLIALVGFRIWETFDVWLAPPSHNRDVRAARMKAGIPSYGLYLAPPLTRDDGGVAGLTWRF